MNLRTLQHGLRDWLTTESIAVQGHCGQGAGAGLTVYLNNYRAQLLACLSESYGTVRAWLGDAAFEAAAATHIDAVPPTSWTLDAYGLDFPATLDGLYPDDPEIGELARLECALGLAFVAPDHEGLGPDALAAVDWDHAVLVFAPSLTTLPAKTNAAAIWSAIAEGIRPSAADLLPASATTLIWRDGLTPAFRTMSASEADALEMLREGHAFGALCQRLVEHLGETEGPAAVGGFLAQWIADGLVIGCR